MQEEAETALPVKHNVSTFREAPGSTFEMLQFPNKLLFAMSETVLPIIGYGAASLWPVCVCVYWAFSCFVVGEWRLFRNYPSREFVLRDELF